MIKIKDTKFLVPKRNLRNTTFKWGLLSLQKELEDANKTHCKILLSYIDREILKIKLSNIISTISLSWKSKRENTSFSKLESPMS